MSVPKILLYYSFAPIADPEAVRLWQLELCRNLGLRGRIIVSKHGINGTVGGEIDACKQYLKRSKTHPAFANLDVKWSDGTAFDDDAKPEIVHGVDRSSPWRQITDFPRLSVKAREEIVSFGAPEELSVDADGVVGGGARLTPTQVNELVAERGDEVVFFDGRNAFEAQIGKFKNAVIPDVSTTHDFIREIDSGKYDHLKDKPVVTYCTGGIRCEVLSSLMIKRGFKELYQIDGGIVRYGEQYGNEGLWEGSLYVFDARGKVDFSSSVEAIAKCELCQSPCDSLTNCQEVTCREQLPACQLHRDDIHCSKHKELIKQ